MKTRALLMIVPMLLFAVGCDSPEPAGDASDQGGQDGAAPVEVALDTPAAAAETFIRAAENEDADGLARCLAEDAEGEFRPLAEGSASAEMLGELADMFEGASVEDTETSDGTASVEVKLPNHPRGRETLNLVKEGESWRVRGF